MSTITSFCESKRPEKQGFLQNVNLRCLHIFGRERYARPERRKVPHTEPERRKAPHTELLTETEAAFGKQGGTQRFMLGENIKTLRKQKGYSQEMLAEQLNVVRQTVSKWEKNLSVPDAEMLERMADLFEVPVTALLGRETQTEEKENAELSEIVSQLAILNEQLAKQNRGKKRTRKIVAGVAAGLFALYIVLILLAIFFKATNDPVGNTHMTYIHCMVDGESHTYGIRYDDQFRILEAGGSAWIADHVEAETCGDANVLIARIENLMKQWGGTWERVDEFAAGVDSNGGTTHHYEDHETEAHSSEKHHE